MRFPRFTIRTLMIAVAVVGSIVFAGMETKRLRRLAKIYDQRAQTASGEERMVRATIARFAKLAAAAERAAGVYRSGLIPPDDPIQTSLRVINERYPPRDEPVEANRRQKEFLEIHGSISEEKAQAFRRHERTATEFATYLATLRRKYERAARYPWLPVEPDPPESK